MKQALYLIFLGAVLTWTVGCTGNETSERGSEADSLIMQAQNAGDYRHVIEVADSLEQTGDISPFRSAFLQGAAYTLLNELQLAQEKLQTAMEMTPKSGEDSTYYIRSVLRMAELCGIENDYEGLLRVALPAIEWLKDMEGTNGSRARSELHSFVGYAQYALGMKEEAARSFDLSYSNWLQTYTADPTWQNISNTCITTFNVISPYVKDNDFAHIETWTHRHDSAFAVISARKDVPARIMDQIQWQNALLHAHLALVQNRQDEAMRALDDYRKTEYSKTTTGKIMAAGVLLKAGCYAEAADIFMSLDQYLAEKHIDFSLDVINEMLGDKFKANYNAGRRDTALAVAAIAFSHLDSAIVRQKESDAAEMATVYETQKKDAEIASQKIALSQLRWMGTLAALVLLTIFFIVYTLYRRRAENRLAAAHESLEHAHNDLEHAHSELQTAYDQLEETTAAKERIESELRIARDIQMSMVPQEFPQYEGLDMYAVMNPAKEVGGDLYDYVLQGSMLHFCLGDVSGKGVPASLFMSQSDRLFRTLAAEGLSPTDIAVRMNKGLAENNKRMMFVTMFIGLLHLDTGRLDFCNCGHNPPVIDGQFLNVRYENHPLGFWGDDPFEGETIDDIRGHQLLMYTDGLNEAENAQKEQFGNDRLQQLMADMRDLSSHVVIDRLKEAVEQHRNGTEPNDDLTMMYLKIK